MNIQIMVFGAQLDKGIWVPGRHSLIKSTAPLQFYTVQHESFRKLVPQIIPPLSRHCLTQLLEHNSGGKEIYLPVQCWIIMKSSHFPKQQVFQICPHSTPP